MTIDLIKKLYYEDGLSCREIGNKLNKTVWQVINIMKNNKLKLRASAETQKIQFYKKPLSFKKKIKLRINDKLLQYAGLMLYLAEGTKTDNRTVDLANSNEKIIFIFLKMLRELYGVDKNKIRVLIYCYANQNPKLLIDYWSDQLKIPPSQFTKPYVRKDFDIKKINKLPHGLVHIRYNDKRLFLKIFEEIDIIATNLLKSQGGRVDKCTSL